MASASFLWAKVLSYIEKKYSASIVVTLFDDIDVVDFTDNQLVLYTSNEFRSPILETQCIPHIKEAMLAVGQQDVEVTILDDKSLAEYHSRDKKKGDLDAINQEFTFDNFVVGPSNRPMPITRFSSTAKADWARPICSTPLPTILLRIIRTSILSTSKAISLPMS